MSWLGAAADPCSEQPVRQLRVDTASPSSTSSTRSCPRSLRRSPDGLIGRTVAAGRLEGSTLSIVAQHRYQLGTADAGREPSCRRASGSITELQDRARGPNVIAEAATRCPGLAVAPIRKPSRGLLGGRLPPDEGRRLPGGTGLNEAGDGPELVVVLVGLPATDRCRPAPGNWALSSLQLVLAAKTRHGAVSLPRAPAASG